jgi:hypothetical protein
MTIYCSTHCSGAGAGAVRRDARRAARGSLPGASAVSITAARLPVTHTNTRQLRRRPSGRQLTQQRSSPSGRSVASDGHTRAHAERPVAMYYPSHLLLFRIYVFVMFLLWLALYGAGMPPEPSGQAEAEHVRLAPTAEWVSVRGLCPREVACARPARASAPRSHEWMPSLGRRGRMRSPRRAALLCPARRTPTLAHAMMRCGNRRLGGRCPRSSRRLGCARRRPLASQSPMRRGAVRGSGTPRLEMNHGRILFSACNEMGVE